MERSIRFPKYKIKEYPDRIKDEFEFGDRWPYTLFKKFPLIPIYYPITNSQTLKEAIHDKQVRMEIDKKKKEKRWVSDAEQFSEIL